MPWLPARRQTTLARPEVRVPKAATQSISWYNREHPMPSEWDAERAFRYAYIGNAVVFRCVQIISNDIAALPLRIGPNREKPTVYRDKHPLAILLSPPPHGPNPTFGATQLLSHAVASYIVAGRFGWELELNKQKVPQFIWPLATPNLHPVLTDGGSEWYKEFWYFVTGSTQKKILQPNQIHYQWRPSQIDFRQPESVIQAARLDISVAIMQDRYDHAFLTNDARPAAIIVHEEFEEEAEKLAFRNQFLSSHQGPENAGKIAWAQRPASSDSDIDKSIYVEQLGLTQRDAEFAKRYEAKIRNICAALGVPLSKLDASGRTYDNAAAEDKTYWQDTIKPLADTLAGNFSISLLNRFPGSEQLAAWFDFSGVEALKPHVEPKTQKIDVVTLRDKGFISIDEGRADYGLAPLNTPESQKVEERKQEPPPLIPGIPGLPATNGNNNSKELEPVKEDVGSGRMVRYTGYRPTHRDIRKFAIIRETDAVVNSLETLVEREFNKLFAAQEEATIARLEGRRGKTLLNQMPKASNRVETKSKGTVTYPITTRQAIGNIFDYDYWQKRTADTSEYLLEAIFLQGGIRVANKLGISFDINQPYAMEFIRNRANQLAGMVTDTTYKKITAQLAEGVNFGEGIPQLVKRIRQVFGDASRNRAKTIARTETISAYNGSAKRVASQEAFAGIVAQEWIATSDERVRETHHAADGQIVGMGERFNVGGNAMDYPGDPTGPADEVVNCRCTIGFWTAEELGVGQPARSLPELQQQQQQIGLYDVYQSLQELKASVGGS